MAAQRSGLAVRPKQNSDQRVTREKILDCAAALYSRHGYGEGSIRNIAAEIGIRGPSLYHHFASKEEVTLELIRIAARTACSELDQALSQTGVQAPEHVLDAAIAAHLRALFHPKHYLAALLRIYSEVPTEMREVISAELSPYLTAWMGILRRVYRRTDDKQDLAEIHVFFIFGAMNSVIEWHYGRRAERFSLDSLRAILRDLLFRGLG